MIKLLSPRTESSLVSIRLRSTLRPFSILPLLLWLLSTPGANAAIETAKPSDDFVESVGVVTHIPYTGGAYGNYTGVVKPRLIELGVRYIRDGIVARGSQFGRDAFATKLLDLQTTTGIKAVLLFSGDSMTTVSNFLTSCSAAVVGVEGPNEPDLSQYNFIYNGNGWQGGVAVGQGWAVGAKNYQTDLFNLVNNTPAFNNWDILQMSMGWGGNASSVGNHEAFADLGNFHWYVQTAYPPELPNHLDWLTNNARIISPTKQLMPTEAGYPAVSAASEAVHGRYVMRILCEGFRRNFKRTFIYELIDENTTDKFGLLRNNNTARPAFTGIKNLITLLKDTGAPFTPGSLNYTVTDSSTAYPTDSAGLRRFLVQKSDGRFLLVIWHAAKSGFGGGTPNPISVPNRSVTIGFASTHGSIKTYLPLNGSTVVQTFTNKSSIVVSVPDHPLVIEITPNTARWAMNETSGTVASDSSGNGLNATLTGSPIWTAGKVGGALSLNGSTQFGQVADSPQLDGTNKLSISLWVRPTNLDSTNPRFLVSKRINATNNCSYSLFFHTGNKLFVDIDGSNNRFSTNTTFANNTWYHIALTYDGTAPAASRVKLYVNGLLNRTAAETSASIPNYASDLWFGQANASYSTKYGGLLDEVQILRHTLTSSEIESLAGLIPTEVILDNAAATGVLRVGTWTTSTAVPGYYGANFLHDGNSGKGTKTVKFTPTITASGSYNVYIHYTSDATRASNVPIDIVYNGGTEYISLDQRSGGGAWVLLGTYNFSAGTAGSVTVGNAGTTGFVIADAIRLVPN